MVRSLLILVLFVINAAVSSLYAQGTTSRAVGTVVDPAGSPVPGATVKLTNEGTRGTFSTTTSSSGTYVVDSLQVGDYTLEVEAPGFKKFVSRGNALTIGAPMSVTAALDIGTLSESVEVSGSAEQVQTSTSGNFGNLFSQNSIRELPIVGTRGRSPLDLVLIQPGVVAGANTGGGVHVNGARDRSWNYTLDGIDINETSASGSDFSPLRTNPDSIAEFRVITGNATAEYGRNSGGQVAMVTNSGTNSLHGEAFWFYRTPRLNANDYTNTLDGIGKAQFVQNITGLSMGGPIIKNKTFVFGNVQFLQAKNTASTTRTVYTAQARQGILRYVIGGRNQPAGTATASVDAAGNVLAGVQTGTYNVVANDPQHIGIDKVIQGYLGNMPLPNRFDTAGTDGLNTAGFVFAAGQLERQHDDTIKVDHIFNSKNTVYFRGAWGAQDTNCDAGNGGQPVFTGLPCIVNTERSPQNLAFNWRWSPTPVLTNELVVGQSRFTFNFNQPSNDLTQIGFNSAPVNTTAIYDFANLRTLKTYQVVDNLTWIHEAHTLKFGTNLRFQKHFDVRGSIAGQDATTDIDFSRTINTVDPATFNLPSALNVAFDQPNFQDNINFLLGRVGNVTRGFASQGDQFVPGLFKFESDYPELDFYAHDTWKVTPRLVIDAGLRWEIKLTPGNPDNLITRPNQAITAGAPPTNTLKWVNGSFYNSDFHAFGPSIGLAWDPTGHGTTAIRANYRLAYDRIQTFALSSTVIANLPGLTQGLVNTDYGQAGGRLANLQPLPAPTVKPSDLRQPPPFSNNSITVVDPSLKTPTTHEWGVSLQHQIARNTIVEADYIGRRAYHLLGAYNANQDQIFSNGFLGAFNTVKAGGESPFINQLLAADSRLNPGETGSQLVRRLSASTLALNSVGALAGSLATRLQGGKSVTSLSGAGVFPLIPFPQFGGGFNVIDSNDFSTYHALQLQLQRRYQNGLTGQISYSFSKSLDTRSFDPTFSQVSTGN
ncbi:MAG: TonB-dependent receptor, partial [Acidobacteriota bacterium]|nr:TonB-dependent receptor [Acidobacteriota bacterium]